jgi:Calcineurin-like phosphoesterase
VDASPVYRKDGLAVHPISWLHICDFHMRASDAWSQDVVLKAMCRHIEREREEGSLPDFILATGDLAFSGEVEEYKLAAPFFDAVSAASGVPKNRIYCIPGNHDIARDRQKMSFQGARNFIQSQNQVDLLLSAGEDLQTLLKREENYRKFQHAYFTGQERNRTADGLGYVSCIAIDDVRLGIIALDSAWLADGGQADHGKLLIGERQLINAMDLIAQYDCHIVVGMAHHPIHLLQDFDRRSVQSRIERSCQFFHCGHLHEPEAAPVGFSGSGCLRLAAGASFESRRYHNSYSFITLDLLRAKRTVKTIQYDPTSGAFSSAASQTYPIEITPAGTCSVGELAHAIKVYRTSLSPLAYYFAALLLDQKSELPIAQNSHVFGSFAVISTQPDDDFRRKTIEFMAFRNVLRVFYKRVPLSDLFARYGHAVGNYGAALQENCHAHPELMPRLTEQEKDAQAIAIPESQASFSHTVALLTELAEAREWDQLRAQAERHLDSTDGTLARQAKRMLALSFANSEKAADKAAATTLYRLLIQEGSAEVTDTGNLATLLIEASSFEEAQIAVLEGIEKFPGQAAGYLYQIGASIVEATGDKEFRKQLKAAVEAKGEHD